MNRRAFIRGTISVMAVASLLKGRVTSADADQLSDELLETHRRIYELGGQPSTFLIPDNPAVVGKLHEWVVDELRPAELPETVTEYVQVVEPVQIFTSEFGHRTGRVRLLGQNLRRRAAAYRRALRKARGLA